MSNYFNGYEPNGHHGHHPKHNSVVSGNSIDIKMNECKAAEVRADVIVETAGGKDKHCNVVRLWGQIKDCCGKPVPNALLKLVKVVCSTAGTQYQGIAHTVSDCEGFYQFDLCYHDGTECYKVLVSKAYTDAEQVLLTGHGNCKACTGHHEQNGGYHPCKPYTPIVTQLGPDSKCECHAPHPCPPHPCPPQPCPPQPCPPHPIYPPYPCNKHEYEYEESINIPSPCGN